MESESVNNNHYFLFIASILSLSPTVAHVAVMAKKWKKRSSQEECCLVQVIIIIKHHYFM